MGSLGLGDLLARVGLDGMDKVDELDGIYLSAKFWDLLQKLTLDEEDGNVVSDYDVSSDTIHVQRILTKIPITFIGIESSGETSRITDLCINIWPLVIPLDLRYLQILWIR